MVVAGVVVASKTFFFTSGLGPRLDPERREPGERWIR